MHARLHLLIEEVSGYLFAVFLLVLSLWMGDVSSPVNSQLLIGSMLVLAFANLTGVARRSIGGLEGRVAKLEQRVAELEQRESKGRAA